jgi:hypothetical protein
VSGYGLRCGFLFELDTGGLETNKSLGYMPAYDVHYPAIYVVWVSAPGYRDAIKSHLPLGRKFAIEFSDHSTENPGALIISRERNKQRAAVREGPTMVQTLWWN